MRLTPSFMGLIILRAFIVLKQSGCTIAFHQEDNGKPCENAGRKATGLTPVFPGLMAAGIPGTFSARSREIF